MTAATATPRVREVLAALVACPSVSGQERAVMVLAARIAGELGLEPEHVGESLVVRPPGSPADAPVRLLLVSHLDTVPVGEGWSEAPYAGRWRDGRLVGRGANDAKASAAAMVCALAGLREGAAARGVVLALNAREETTNDGMREVLARLGPPGMAVVGEPTGLEVVRAQGGLVVLEAEWEGRACHAAHAARSGGDSALIAAAEELAAFGPCLSMPAQDALLGPTTFTPTVLESGTRHNVVPDRALAVFDARVGPPFDGPACAQLLSARLPRARVRVRSERLRAVVTPADHPLVTGALAAAGRGAAVGSHTLSDMALLAGVPAVKCGPGDSLRSHRADEFVLAEELEAGERFYRDLLLRLAP